MDISCIQPKIAPVLQPILNALMCNKSASPLPQIEKDYALFDESNWPNGLDFWFGSSNATDWSAVLEMFLGEAKVYEGTVACMPGAKFGFRYITDEDVLVSGTEFSYTLTVSKAGYSDYVENGTYTTPVI